MLARRKRERMVNKARASSWALYFYLAKTDPDGLRRYLDELRKLPRDLPLDEKAAVETFARALHLSTGKAAEAGKRPLKEFAAAWVNSVKAEPLHGVEFHLKTPDSRPVDPTRPFGPGGFPGFPGAGGPGGEGP